MEENEYQEMIKDWQINADQLSAIHKSGLKMQFLGMEGEKYKTHVEGYKDWASAEILQAKRENRVITSEQLSENYAKIGAQFAEIVCHVQSQKVSSQIKPAITRQNNGNSSR